MKFNLDATVMGPDLKTPMLMEKGSDRLTTFRDVCLTLLLTELPGDAQAIGLKYRLHRLNWLFQQGGEVELETTDVQLLEQRAQLVHPVFVFGQIVDALHNRSEPADQKLESVPAIPPMEPAS